jgi:molybdenum cofactor synthesis domain-containing protein
MRKDLKGITARVLTLSDSCAAGARVDVSGRALAQLLEARGASVKAPEVLPDDRRRIEARLRSLCDRGRVDLVVTTGGTGLGPRDVTPEATRAVVAKEVPGLVELMRLRSLAKTERAALSRATAGVRGRTLIVNFPGSPSGAADSFKSIAGLIPHALAMVRGEGHERKPR